MILVKSSRSVSCVFPSQLLLLLLLLSGTGSSQSPALAECVWGVAEGTCARLLLDELYFPMAFGSSNENAAGLVDIHDRTMYVDVQEINTTTATVDMLNVDSESLQGGPAAVQISRYDGLDDEALELNLWVPANSTVPLLLPKSLTSPDPISDYLGHMTTVVSLLSLYETFPSGLFGLEANFTSFELMSSYTPMTKPLNITFNGTIEGLVEATILDVIPFGMFNISFGSLLSDRLMANLTICYVVAYEHETGILRQFRMIFDGLIAADPDDMSQGFEPFYLRIGASLMTNGITTSDDDDDDGLPWGAVVVITIGVGAIGAAVAVLFRKRD